MVMYMLCGNVRVFMQRKKNFQWLVHFIVEIMVRVLTFSVMPSWAGWAITALVRWSNKNTSDLSEKYRKQGYAYLSAISTWRKTTLHQ